MNMETSPWKPRVGLKPLKKVQEIFERSELIFPELPGKLHWRVQRHKGKSLMFTTNPKLSPWLPYSLGYLLGEEESQQDFHDLDEEFMICGVNGHGVNSYGFGLIARVGRLLIAQQASYAGAYNDIDEDRIVVNGQTELWNEILEEAELMSHGDGPVHFVEFSNFRGIARVWRRLPDSDSRRSKEPHEMGWEINWQLIADLNPSSGSQSPYFAGVLGDGDMVEFWAIEHLIELGKRTKWTKEKAIQLEELYEDFMTNWSYLDRGQTKLPD